MLKKTSLTFLVLLVVIVGSGFVYEFIASKQDDYPVPGKLVDVGGHRIHIEQLGSGSPTILLEAGSAESSLIWRDIPEQLAETATVVRYDRPGYAWSEEAETERSGKQIAEDLHKSLETEGIKGPYILVGHSLGGLYTRLFAQMYPEETAGLVLVDATPVGFDQETAAIFEEEGLDPSNLGLPSKPLFLLLKHSGVMRLMQDTLLASIPESDRERALDVEMNGSYLDTIQRENELISMTEEALRDSKLGSLPVTVMTRGIANDATQLGMSSANSDRLEQIWQRMQKETLAISDHSRLVIAANSGHMIMHDEPELLVNVIQEMLEELKKSL
jgi:pimeloyl-ACP methyl ester carboxylesterase